MGENMGNHFVQMTRNLPNEKQEVIPGIIWGDYCQLFTPAFWKMQYIMHTTNNHSNRSHKLGENIIEEIVACLLGGYGIPAEIGLMAFERLKKEGLITKGVSHRKIYNTLSKPFKVGNKKQAVYRFYNQKSRFVFEFLNRSDLDITFETDMELREWLLKVKGIGLKTASWITRNWLNSNNVAILDIHILRAGKLTGFFDNIDNVNRDYRKLEKRYLNFCDALQVSASDLDAMIWDYMKRHNKFALKILNQINN